MPDLHPTLFPGLVKQLIDQSIVSETDAVLALEEAERRHIAIIPWLINQKLATAEQVAYAVAIEYGLSMVDLDAINSPPAVRELIPLEQANKLNLISLYRNDNYLMVGLSDPTFLNNIDDIKFATGLTPTPVVVEHHKLEKYLQKNTVIDDGDPANAAGMEVSNNAISQNIVLSTKSLEKADNDDSAILNFVDKLLAKAIRSNVSDIHIEPYEKDFRIRYRIDGILQVVATPPVDVALQLISRLKVMSRMNISERRVPQDGRLRFKYSENKDVDFRVNTLPTLHGEKVVLRILDSSNTELGIAQLGFTKKQQQDFEGALHQPDGMVLVTGPTGSGKTVTLYTGLGLLNTPDRNISTAEDPAEIQVAGINQVNVNAKVGLTFAEALRAFLRQDPDIIMVGEIRDLETAEISIKAAQTGHLVLSTLHTNSAPETITRLLNMGIPAFNLASSINLVIAQRLARRLCPKCRAKTDIPTEVLLELGFEASEIQSLNIYEPVGCNHCSNGYKGRVGIYQVMPVSKEMSTMIMNNGNSLEIEQQARKEGILDIREAGLEKVRQGLTSIAEIERVTKD